MKVVGAEQSGSSGAARSRGEQISVLSCGPLFAFPPYRRVFRLRAS
jgi:hypothetical protein